MIDLPIILSNLSEYSEAERRGYIPLKQWKLFKLPIHLRVEIQAGIFYPGGRPTNIKVINDNFYKWFWANSPRYCENCLKPLHNYSSVYVSHILTRGSHPEMRADPRNANLLCYVCHTMWETGERLAMRIYRVNRIVILILKSDYNGLR